MKHDIIVYYDTSSPYTGAVLIEQALSIYNHGLEKTLQPYSC